MTKTVTTHPIGSYSLQLHSRPGGLRFLLLGPRPANGNARPLLAAGSVVEGSVTVDHGLASSSQLEAIARCAEERAS